MKGSTPGSLTPNRPLFPKALGYANTAIPTSCGDANFNNATLFPTVSYTLDGSYRAGITGGLADAVAATHTPLINTR
jgi:hypothetical protein